MRTASLNSARDKKIRGLLISAQWFAAALLVPCSIASSALVNRGLSQDEEKEYRIDLANASRNSTFASPTQEVSDCLTGAKQQYDEELKKLKADATRNSDALRTKSQKRRDREQQSENKDHLRDSLEETRNY